MPTRRDEQRETTRTLLIRTARSLFGSQGYADTSTTQILEEADLARGALYHHFRDKADLLRAVYEQIEGELVEDVVRAAYADPSFGLWDRTVAAVQRYLELASTEEVRRIVLTDAPSVLGPQAWRELDERYGLGLLKQVLHQGIDEGIFRPVEVQTTAQLLLAVINEGAVAVSVAEDPAHATDEVARTILGFIRTLRVEPSR